MQALPKTLHNNPLHFIFKNHSTDVLLRGFGCRPRVRLFTTTLATDALKLKSIGELPEGTPFTLDSNILHLTRLLTLQLSNVSASLAKRAAEKLETQHHINLQLRFCCL